MFKKLMETLQSMTRTQPVIDPAQFNDQLALQVEWTPARSGGTSFRTHKLVQVHSDRLEFQASWAAKMFCGLFVFIGIMAPSGFLASVFLSDEPLSTGYAILIIPCLGGLVFVALGGILFRYGTAPIVFDKFKGYFWKGRRAPYEVVNLNELKNACKIEHLYALQLLSEYCRGNKTSYYSYELNLILNDGRRINVIDHGNKGKIREDTNTLSTFLNKPVWDGIE
jgi:hypothetical protein